MSTSDRPTTEEARCPRCAHRSHEAGECKARYRVTFEPGEPGDPCLCRLAALPPEQGEPPALWHSDGDSCEGIHRAALRDEPQEEER